MMSDAELGGDATPDSTTPADRADIRAHMARALARGGMPGVQVISWESADEVLTPKRREIIEALRVGEVESVRGLARELGRDKGQVSRDLGVLADHGIVRYDRDGNAKRPRLTQDHVIVEPIV